ncbi:hypothetical protein [Paenibacillus woosongensis]|uniref:Uncharacterized protein n=1 Tax=Paenibacillus woosongensis TaxID=307580 RepID=A0ABQ4MUY3_9BACL|nr:hypothetical protein [Paenibacillus woosongensis]GIP59747.1 hypothetical protein J15TS10_35610 [Paenibacillus woosongensis]
MSFFACSKSIGIHDTPASRTLLEKHLNDILKNPNNISATEVRTYIAKELPDKPVVEYTATTEKAS